MADFDQLMMKRCIELAKNGLGTTYPNPLVGCVIVHNQKIISEGWHRKAGEPHAEVIAINQITDKEVLKECEIFVSLEPCSHFGRTPPCSDMIIRHKFKRVIIGTSDPNSKVNGAGIRKLKDAGIEVRTDVLNAECSELNKRFFCFHRYKRPFIILKWAETANGFMSPLKPKQKWISGEFSKQLVHKWRAEEQAIIIGYNTAKLDNPQLNSRLWSDNQPIRIVTDRDLSLNTDLNLFDKKQRTIIFSEKDEQLEREIKIVKFDEYFEESVLNHLYNVGIQSVIIEGGRKTLDGFVKKKLWDEARIFSSAESWKNGVKSPRLNSELISQKRIGNDLLRIFKR